MFILHGLGCGAAVPLVLGEHHVNIAVVETGVNIYLGGDIQVRAKTRAQGQFWPEAGDSGNAEAWEAEFEDLNWNGSQLACSFKTETKRQVGCTTEGWDHVKGWSKRRTRTPTCKDSHLKMRSNNAQERGDDHPHHAT